MNAPVPGNTQFITSTVVAMFGDGTYGFAEPQQPSSTGDGKEDCSWSVFT